ncbi:MAG: hypothetical protein JSS65_06000 [Armatimonadetes bacterium]|nr:hypothetical protein [Armatimonadota bacterium]
MILPVVAALIAVPTRTVVFVGNSLTGNNDVPAKTVALLNKVAPEFNWQAKYFGCGHLDDALNDGRVTKSLQAGPYAVVLQAQMISMSHKIRYSQDAARKLSSTAREKGSKVYFFAEWPRRGIDETAYIEGIYREIADATKANVIPVGRVWDFVLAQQKRQDLFMGDGNHAAEAGSALAATVIARGVLGTSIKGQVAEGVPRDMAGVLIKGIERVYPTVKSGS